MPVPAHSDPMAAVERLQAAINAHDLDALVACFAPGYVSEAPAHPARDFTGRDQVRRNWSQILGGVPDLHAELVRSAMVGETVWTEWVWSGTRRDGQPHRMAGVTIQTVNDGVVSHARFYMEPVDVSGSGNEAAIERAVGAAHARIGS